MLLTLLIKGAYALAELQAPYVAPTPKNYPAQCHNNINELFLAFLCSYFILWRSGRSCESSPPLYSKTFKTHNAYNLLKDKKL